MGGALDGRDDGLSGALERRGFESRSATTGPGLAVKAFKQTKTLAGRTC